MPGQDQEMRRLEIQQEISRLQGAVEEYSIKLTCEPDMATETRHDIKAQISQLEDQIAFLEREDVSSQPGRGRRQTEKGVEYQRDRVEHHSRTFEKAYVKWKIEAKSTRSQMKRPNNEETLSEMTSRLERSHKQLQECYEAISNLCRPPPDTVNKMDTCGRITADICALADKRAQRPDEYMNPVHVKEEARMVLSKEENPSIFGASDTETNCSNRTTNSRIDAKAELAARLAGVSEAKKIHAQQQILFRMEADMKKTEATMVEQLEAERSKLETMHAERDLVSAAARARVYEESEDMEGPPLELHPADPEVRPNVA